MIFCKSFLRYLPHDFYVEYQFVAKIHMEKKALKNILERAKNSQKGEKTNLGLA